MNKIFSISLIFLSVTFVNGEECNSDTFEALKKSADWELKFEDSGTKNWKSKWSLDGLLGKVETGKDGMTMSAGPEKGGPNHVVLWTKESFKGDIKIEYDFTRIDEIKGRTNILYVQATGSGSNPKDISDWSDQREIPSMKTYWQNMDLFHISYSNGSDGSDYVKLRRYPCAPGEKFSTSTVIGEVYRDTGLFQTGKTYHITFIKKGAKVFFEVQGEDETRLFSWDVSGVEPILEGAIGLRQMYTRVTRYGDFKVYTMN